MIAVHNEGASPLEISAVKPSCGCLHPSWDERIEARAAGQIRVILDSQGLGGSFQKSVTLHTNDPRSSRARVQLRGTIVPLIVHEPEEAILADFPGRPLALELTLRPGPAFGVEVLEATTREGKAEVQLTEITRAREYRVVLNAPPMAHVGIDLDVLELVVRTETGELHEHEIPFLLQGLDRIEVRPSRSIVFQKSETRGLRADPPRPPRKEITLESCVDGFTFEITSVKFENAPPDTFEAESTTVRPGKEYLVTVRLLKAHRFPTVRATLVLTTNRPSNPRYEFRLAAQFDR